MSFYTEPEQLASAWRQLADTANENGETPLFAVGLDYLYRNSWLNLLALSRIARQNLGPQHPTIVAGGEGWLWLFAMLVWRPDIGGYRHSRGADAGTTSERETEGQSEGIDDAGRTILFAGPDSALYAAVLNLAAPRSDRPAIPPGLNWSESLSGHVSVEGADLELLPALVTQEFMPDPAPPRADAWLQKGERWASLVLALALLAAAFIG